MNNWNLSKVWTALILSMLMAVSSCGLPYCKKTPFSNNDLDWMKPYSVGDTLVFFNRENIEFDTLIVTKKTINNPTNKNIFDMEGCNWMEGDNEYKANAEYQIEAYHSGEKYKCLFILEKNCDSKPAEVSLAFWGRYTKKNISTGNVVKDLTIFPQYKWNVVVSDSNLCSGTHQPVLPITNIYWNRDVGLIGYKISRSLYELIK